MRKDISRLTRLTTEMEGLLYVIEHRGDNNGSVHAALVEKYDEFRSLMEAELKAFLAEHEEESETGTPSVAQSRKADTAEEVAAADDMNTEADRLCTNACPTRPFTSACPRRPYMTICVPSPVALAAS